MITDGDGSISQERMESLVSQLNDMKVHVYVLGVGVDSVSDDKGTMDLNTFCTKTDGILFDTTSAPAMQSAVDQINNLETSPVKIEQHVTYTELYPWFLGASAVCWLLYLLSMSIIRQPE